MDREQREQIVRAYRKWAPSYDRLMRRTYHRVERAITRRHLDSLLPPRPDGLLLDAGGGDAAQSVPLLGGGRAGRAVLVDLSPDMNALARRRVVREEAPIEIGRADVAGLPFPDASFDVTLCMGGVLSHCSNADLVLDELRRVTAPAGHLVVSVDNLAVGLRTACRARDAEALRSLVENGTARVFHHRSYPFRVRFFTPKEILAAFAKRGIEVLSIIGKPVFTRFLSPGEVLSRPEVEPRVDLEWPFVTDPRFHPFADQLELVGRIEPRAGS